MTTEEVIKYFEYMHRLDSLIERKLEEKEMLYTLATKRTAGVSDGMPHSVGGNSDKVGNLICRIIEMDEEINNMIDDLADYKMEASDFAIKLERNQFDVIHMNMIQGFKLGIVAKRMHFCYQWTSELKQKGIENLCDIIEKSDLFEKYSRIFETDDKS